MKSNSQSPLYFLGNPLKVVNQESPATAVENQSPYLKAILSGTTKSLTAENDLPVANPDRAAALRYIKESSLLKK
jgi:hypothetical protein